MHKRLTYLLLPILLISGLVFSQDKSSQANPPVDDTKKQIDQKDIEIHNLKEELEYIKKELLDLENANISLRDSLKDKQDSLDTKTVKDENENLRIYHKTIEDDHQLSQDIITELKGTPATAETTGQSKAVLIDDSDFRTKYNEALNQYFDGNIQASQKNFKKLLELRQNHPLSDNCQYWLGECLYAQEKYSEAIGVFQKVKSLGDGNKADAALFKIGLSYLKLNKRSEARAAFSDLEKLYPNSDLVPKARQYNLYQEKF